MNSWLVVFLAFFWIISTDAYENDHNFVDAFIKVLELAKKFMEKG